MTQEFADKLQEMANGQVEEVHHEFQAQGSKKHIERLEKAKDKDSVPDPDLKAAEVGDAFL